MSESFPAPHTLLLTCRAPKGSQDQAHKEEPGGSSETLREGEVECEDQVTPCLSSIYSQTTRGHHAPCGRQSPRSPGNRTHLGQLSPDRMGHLAGTPVHHAASSETVKKPWMSSLDATWSPSALEPRVPGPEKLAASQTWAVFPTHEPHLLFPGRKSTTPHRTTAHLRLRQRRLFRSSFVQTCDD